MSEGDILVRYEIDPLHGKTEDEIREELQRILASRVLEAYFFGSFATPRFTKFSDIDLILVCETDEAFIRRPLLFSDLLDVIPNLDILVYTPEEFHRLTEDPSPGFWRTVSSEMVRFI